MVASQLKILIPVGTETSSVEVTKNALASETMPTQNIWCAQTPKLMKAIATTAATMIG